MNQFLRDGRRTGPGKAALRARFLACEMESGFPEELRADTFEGFESTSAIDTLPRDGKDVTQLDARLRNKYQRNPDKLHIWKSPAACRCVRRQSPSGETMHPAPTPP